MKIGIILQSNNPEHIWNTFRFESNPKDKEQMILLT
ncbi:MAG: DsrE family protein, partial [Candidatus Komeilibacteria bacterium CG10_big_fil_rev_8_21_14_0_10_41_13]